MKLMKTFKTPIYFLSHNSFKGKKQSRRIVESYLTDDLIYKEYLSINKRQHKKWVKTRIVKSYIIHANGQ